MAKQARKQMIIFLIPFLNNKAVKVFNSKAGQVSIDLLQSSVVSREKSWKGFGIICRSSLWLNERKMLFQFGVVFLKLANMLTWNVWKKNGWK